jgi:L-threonylcarbamoyladenylate synthase
LHLGTQSLAFRVPKPKGLQSLLKKTGPLVAPSANPEGMKPALTMREAKKYFGNAVALYVPGLVHRAPSSLVSLLGPTPVVISRGTVKIS